MIKITRLDTNFMTTIDLVAKAMNLSENELVENKDYINTLIKAASNYIEQYTERVYNYSDITEKIEGTGQLYIYTQIRPIKELTEIKLFDTVIDPANYDIDNPNTGSIYKETGWLDYTKFDGYIEYQPSYSKTCKTFIP